MTASELRDRLARDLAKAQGGGAARWRRAVGEVRSYPRATHSHCNWEVRPAGSPGENAIVERAADALRAVMPFVDEP